MKLSLIICTYCRPDDVTRLLQSVAGQTEPPDETLVIDATPDQRTVQAVEAARTADPRLAGVVMHYVDAEHRGLTRQRNFGIERASGDILAFVDDDTILAPDYIAQLRECFVRNPQTPGVGGFVTNEIAWRRLETGDPPSSREFAHNGYARREDLRWRLRRWLRLDATAAPGFTPLSGHGRAVGFLPPDGQEHPTESLMGCAFAFRREVAQRHRFSSWFEGYGLYEDLDFCTRVVKADGPLLLCTRAQLEHHHSPGGRPRPWRYGKMVVRNGWRVWRTRWPKPPIRSRLRWWTITWLLTMVRLLDVVRGPRRWHAVLEAFGRMHGALGVWVWPPPREQPAD